MKMLSYCCIVFLDINLVQIVPKGFSLGRRAAGVPGTRASSNCKYRRAAVYGRRRPERSAAYQVVRQNFETWLAQRRADRLVAGAKWVVDPVPG